MSKQELIDEINAKIASLDKEDATGHLYWYNFRSMVTNFKSKEESKTAKKNEVSWFDKLFK